MVIKHKKEGRRNDRIKLFTCIQGETMGGVDAYHRTYVQTILCLYEKLQKDFSDLFNDHINLNHKHLTEIDGLKKENRMLKDRLFVLSKREKVKGEDLLAFWVKGYSEEAARASSLDIALKKVEEKLNKGSVYEQILNAQLEVKDKKIRKLKLELAKILFYYRRFKAYHAFFQPEDKSNV